MLVYLYAFLCFLHAFCAFLCVKQRRQHFYAHKKHLRRRKSLVWRFVLYVLFMLFTLYMRIKNIWVKFAYLRFVLFVCVWNLFVKNKTALIPLFILLLNSSFFFAIFFNHHNLFQLSQLFLIITIFLNFFTACNTIFMKISQHINSIT